MKPESELIEALGTKKAKGKALSFCVAGAGNGGLAMAGHLGLMGFPVSLYNRTDEALNGVRWHGGISVEGAVEGFGPVRLASSDMAEAIEGCDVVMVVTPATAHKALASSMAPHLRTGQCVLLNPGRTGGALEFSHVLRDAGCTAQAIVAEAQTFLYASRALSRSSAKIFKIKNAIPVATLPAHWIPDLLAILRPAFPCFVAGTNVLSTSLENIGAVFHPALTLLNMGWIEATGGDFQYYLDGITPSVAMILEKVDSERVAVATALGIRTVTAREWLYLNYDSPGKNLYEAIQGTAAYKGIMAPSSANHRYVSEDVPMSLVPIASIGKMLGVSVDTIEMIVDLACLAHGVDYRAVGRTAESLGIAGLSVKEIRQMAVGLNAGEGE
jgi:opine dehydrogenase